MSSVDRIRNSEYTEADVQVLYLKYRECQIGPFVREIGDFIAHTKRDRGATLNATVFMFSQIAFYQTYQSQKGQPLEPSAACGWWLKHYLLNKAKTSQEKVLKKAIGLNRKKSIEKIKSWFPENSNYPTIIQCADPDLLHQLASAFCRQIVIKPVFDLDQAKKEISHIFKAEKIDESEFDRFLVATAVMISGKSVEVVPGFTATIKLSIDQKRLIYLDENGSITVKEKAKFVRPTPDGSLKILVSTKNQRGDGLINCAFDFLDTNIDTEHYFDRALVQVDQNRIPKLVLDQQLSFAATKTPPVHTLSK